jgi:acyl-CoA thioesterase FadM
MNLWFRLLYQLLCLPLRSRLGLWQPSNLRLRCWPSDLDINLHMNNGRFLSLMDLGRLDLVNRTGLLKTMLRRRWRPILGAAQIRFMKPIGPGQEFRLETRLLGWEGKWFWMRQAFYLGEKLAAEAFVKALFLGPGGSIQADEVLRALGLAESSPPLEGLPQL